MKIANDYHMPLLTKHIDLEGFAESATTATTTEINAATTTAVLVTQRLTSKRKTPLTAPGYANSSITATEATSVLSTYASSRGNTNETNTMPRSGDLSPPAKQRRCGRTSDYVSTVDLFNQLL